MNSKITQLKKITKSFYKRNIGKIEDIVVFGSFMRGKEKPSDIDILMIFKENIDKNLEYDYRKKMPANISVISKTLKTCLDRHFDGREGYLFEGFSLVKSHYTASDYGFASFGAFIYETSQLDNTTKTRFYYALNGRGGSNGAIGTFEGIKISDNTIFVPLIKIEQARDFFDFWKLEYKFIPVLLPERLARKAILAKLDDITTKDK